MPRCDIQSDTPADADARRKVTTACNDARRDARLTRFTPTVVAAFVDETVDDVDQAIAHLAIHANAYESATEPTSPYVGMLWLDTS